jgi:hypothetical protein
MKMRALRILAVVAMLATLFAAAGAEEQAAVNTVQYNKYGFSVSLDLPDGWTEAELLSWESGNAKWADPMDGKVRQVLFSNYDMYPTMPDDAMERYGFDGRDGMSLRDSEALREACSTDDADGEFLGFQDVCGLTFATHAQDADREMDGQGTVRLHVLTYRTVHKGVMLGFSFSASEYEDADMDFFSDIMNTLVVAGDGPGYDEKSDRRAVSFEKDGHVVEMEIPCYLEVEPDPAFDAFVAYGSWKDSYLSISVKCDDLWDTLTEEERGSFGAKTREEYKAACENDMSMMALQGMYDALDLNWTRVEIGDAAYIAATETIDGSDALIAHYATLCNGAMIHFRFYYYAEPDIDAIILSTLETVKYAY